MLNPYCYGETPTIVVWFKRWTIPASIGAIFPKFFRWFNSLSFGNQGLATMESGYNVVPPRYKLVYKPQ